MISFVGAGPGAPDLITLRGAQRLADAEIVIWAASLVPEAVLSHCRADVVLHDSKVMSLEQVTAVFAANAGASIVRLHSGDPAVYSAIGEQVAWCVDHDLPFEVVPGVSSMAAAAAAAGHELTIPGLSQSVVMTRLAHRTSATVPERESVAAFAKIGATMAVFLSAARPEALAGELACVDSAFSADTPVVIAHRVSWPDEQIVRSTVGTLASDLAELGATTTVLVLVGPALAAAAPPARTHVYLPSFATAHRPAT